MIDVISVMSSLKCLLRLQKHILNLGKITTQLIKQAHRTTDICPRNSWNRRITGIIALSLKIVTLCIIYTLNFRRYSLGIPNTIFKNYYTLRIISMYLYFSIFLFLHLSMFIYRSSYNLSINLSVIHLYQSISISPSISICYLYLSVCVCLYIYLFSTLSLYLYLSVSISTSVY